MIRSPTGSTRTDTLLPYTTLFRSVEVARAQIASVLNEKPERVFFTSGATESVNWALKGIMSAPGQRRRRLVTIATEHACVLDSAAWLASVGADVVVQIGRAHVGTPVTNAHLVCSLLLEKKKIKKEGQM